MMLYTYSKNEKLKSKKLISTLFASGKSVSAYPLRLIYLKTNFNDTNITFKTGVSVPKKNFKKAVQRVLIKRYLREAYRLHKNKLQSQDNSQFALLIIYIGTEKPNYSTIENAIQKLFVKFLNKIN